MQKHRYLLDLEVPLIEVRCSHADWHTEILEDAVMQPIRGNLWHKDGDMLRTRCYEMERRPSIPALQIKILEGAMMCV